jgi:hypothetical protein
VKRLRKERVKGTRRLQQETGHVPQSAFTQEISPLKKGRIVHFSLGYESTGYIQDYTDAPGSIY